MRSLARFIRSLKEHSHSRNKSRSKLGVSSRHWCAARLESFLFLYNLAPAFPATCGLACRMHSVFLPQFTATALSQTPLLPRFSFFTAKILLQTALRECSSSHFSTETSRPKLEIPISPGI